MALKTNLFAIIFFILSPPHGLAATYEVVPGESSAEFLAVGRPSMLKIRGKSASPSGKIELNGAAATGLISVDLDQFETGIDLRNRHMKEKYLQTGSPNNKIAKIKITKIALPTDAPNKGGKFTNIPFTGILSLHGVDREISGTANLELSASNLLATAKFSIQLGDYKIDIPSYAGVKVAENVEIEATIKAKK